MMTLVEERHSIEQQPQNALIIAQQRRQQVYGKIGPGNGRGQQQGSCARNLRLRTKSTPHSITKMRVNVESMAFWRKKAVRTLKAGHQNAGILHSAHACPQQPDAQEIARFAAGMGPALHPG